MPTPQEREVQSKINVDLLEACLDAGIRVILLPDGSAHFETELDRQRFEKFKTEYEESGQKRLGTFWQGLSQLKDKIAQVDSASVNAPPSILKTGESQEDGTMSDREQLAQWMLVNGFSTGHGETVRELLAELQWQVDELRNKETHPF